MNAVDASEHYELGATGQYGLYKKIKEKEHFQLTSHRPSSIPPDSGH